MKFVALLEAAAILFFAANARADDASDSARSETLFREGKALMTANDFESACPKLAESERIEPASGTLLALAICDERRGHAASSYAEFLALVVLAGKEGHHDRLEIAKQRLAVIAPTVAHITLSMSAENFSLKGLVVTLDGTAVGSSQLRDAWPVDPGDHQLKIVADGDVHFSKVVDVAPAAQREIFIPDLRPESSGVSTQHTLGAVGIGVGAAGIVAGSVFGALAITGHHSAIADCGSSVVPGACSNLAAVNENDTARSFATASTIFILSGAVVTMIGVSVYLMAPRARPTATASARPTRGPTLGVTFGADRVGLVGTFD